MKSPADAKNTIFEAITEEWHLLARRSDAPILPLLHKFYVMVSPAAEKLYGTTIRSISIWKENDQFELYLSGEDYRKAINAGTKLLFSGRSKTHIKTVINYCNKAIKTTSEFGKIDLSKLSDEQLWDQYIKVIEPYMAGFIHGFITWCAQVAQKEALFILEDKKKTLSDLKLDPKEALAVLISSTFPTAHDEKEAELKLIAEKYGKDLSNLNGINKIEISKKSPDLYKAIELFLDKYQWVGYDYGGPAVSFKEVADTLRDRISDNSFNEDKKNISKSELAKRLALTPDEKSIFDNFSLLSHIKDLRNTSDDLLHFSLDFFFHEVGKRRNLSRLEVRSLWPDELKDLLYENSTPKPEYLKNKASCALAESDSSGGWKFFVGNTADKYADKTIYADETESLELEVLKGMSASAGKVTGVARIVKNFEDSSKVEKGDILVASMTSPRLMSAIIRCGAIVTDEGGLTCHAAIIARELKKPCIIGTKIATKILKDGDIIEVDANSGFVRKLRSK